MKKLEIFTTTVLITTLLADELEKMRPAYHCDFRKTFDPKLVNDRTFFLLQSFQENEMAVLTFWMKFEQSLIWK